MAKRKQPTKREVAEENKSAWTRFSVKQNGNEKSHLADKT